MTIAFFYIYNTPVLEHSSTMGKDGVTRVIPRPLPSEGKGHTFDSCRVRQPSYAGTARPEKSLPGDPTPLNAAGEADGPAGAELGQRVADGLPFGRD